MMLRFCRLARRTPSRGKRVVYRQWCAAKLDRIMAKNAYYGQKNAFMNKYLAGESPLIPWARPRPKRVGSRPRRLTGFCPWKTNKSPAGWGTGNPDVDGHNPLAAVPEHAIQHLNLLSLWL
jgi:hypothetical protein